MNLQNLVAQLGSATNPLQMMMSLLNPNQKQLVSNFQGKTTQEQAEEIAKMCNEKGINKEEFIKIMNVFNKR